MFEYERRYFITTEAVQARFSLDSELSQPNRIDFLLRVYCCIYYIVSGRNDIYPAALRPAQTAAKILHRLLQRTANPNLRNGKVVEE